MQDSTLNNQVYILRHIDPNKWSNIKKYQFTNDDIGPGLDDQGLPVTGLTENSFRTTEKGRKEEVKGTRELMETRLGYEAGTLHKGSQFKPSAFWLTYFIRHQGSDLKFDTAIPQDELAVHFLKAQSNIAFGISAKTSKTEYVLFTREEEAKQSNTRKKSRRSAYTLFEKLTQQDMSEILEMTGAKVKSMTADIIEDKLSDYMEEYPNKFIAMVEDPTRKQKTFVRRCLDKGLMHMEDGAVVYNETVLGHDVNSSANKLFSEECATMLAAIKIQLEE